MPPPPGIRPRNRIQDAARPGRTPHTPPGGNMKNLDYDILQPAPKSGALTLTANWMAENLGTRKGEKILAVRAGDKVVLQRLDPARIIGEDLQVLLGGEPQSAALSDEAVAGRVVVRTMTTTQD